MTDIPQPLLRAMLDSIPSRGAILGADRRYLYANEYFLKFFGFSLEEIVGKTVAEIMGVAMAEHMAPRADRVFAGETVRWEGWFTYQPGAQPHYIQQTLTPYRSGDGPVEAVLVLARDITDLKQAEQVLAERAEELRASAALNAAIISSSLDCIIVIDETGSVIEFNPVAEQTFLYRREAAIGRPIGELIVPPAHRERHHQGLKRYLETGERRMLGRRIEVDAMRADGTIFPVELAITEVKRPGVRVFTASIRDLTGARAAAAEIERQREAIHQREKLAALGSLLAGIAHELNNPLSIVIGHSQMLQETSKQPETADRAAKIQAAAERCARIVRTFLAMARQRQTERRHVVLGEIVDSALELVAYGLRASGIEVICELQPDLPAVLADSDQLHQVLINLVINAQQALENSPHPRRIAISATASAAEPREIRLTVSDNGPGVPPDIASRIFDPFFTTKPVGAGTGVGLAVCRGIVEAHGGRLSLAASFERGACFEIRLPVTDIEPEDAGIQPEEAAPSDSASVLIIDDEPDLAELLSEILGRDALYCDVATGGREAQRLIRERDYDAIICDVRMPDLDGAAFFDWLDAERPELTSRLVFVTGDTLGPAARRFVAESGRPVVEKPFVPTEIRQLIGQIIAGGNN